MHALEQARAPSLVLKDTTAATVAVAFVCETIIVCHGAQAPTDEDWGHYLDIIAEHGAESRAQLIVSEGGAPKAKQRAQALKIGKLAFAGRPMVPSAVMTGSPVVRAMVTLFNWIFPHRYRAFASHDFAQAAHFLGLSTPQKQMVENTVRVLRHRCS